MTARANRKFRDLRNLIEQVPGAVVEGMSITKNNHIRVQVRVGSVTFPMVAPGSGSDYRGQKNFLAELRRRVRDAKDDFR